MAAHAQPDDTPAVERDTVLLWANGLAHGPACGERIACPACDMPLGENYLPAERQVRWSGTFILCHLCGGRWREIAA